MIVASTAAPGMRVRTSKDEHATILGTHRVKGGRIVAEVEIDRDEHCSPPERRVCELQELFYPPLDK